METLTLSDAREARDMVQVRRSLRNERGASLVEFALIAPLLFLLLFGIIEFAWLFAQNLDVKHGAREGARLAAVDELTGAADVCARMDSAAISGQTLVSATRSDDPIGSDITVTVDAPAETLTGFLDWAIPAGTRLQSTVVIRLEQPASWAEFTGVACP